MSLITKDNVIAEVLVRNNRTTADSFITYPMLNNWYVDANRWAAASYKWPFTEGRVSTTFTTGSGEDSDEYEFEGYKADSFRIVRVGGKRLQKLNFADYLIMKEERPDSTDKVFSDFNRVMFINQNAALSGTTVCYGQIQEDMATIDEDHESVFTNWDREGNEAIVEIMSAYLKTRENKLDESNLHKQLAQDSLDRMWKRIQDEQYAYHTSPEREGMFKYFGVTDETGSGRSSVDENQF